jgi:hypothetical protein
MTEADWLDSTDPARMLEFLRRTGKASDRKLLLFGSACCRRLLPLFPIGALRRAVECGERAADGLADPQEAFEAERALAQWPVPRRGLPRALTDTMAAGAAGTWMSVVVDPLPPAIAVSGRLGAADDLPPVPSDRRGAEGDAVLAARLLIQACGARWDYLVQMAVGHCADAVWVAANDRYQVLRCPAGEEARVARATWQVAEAAMAEERQAQADLLRDIFGNPFRPPPALPPSLRTGKAVALAQHIYDEHRFERMRELADALEGAGAPEEVVKHLRSPGPHWRGCAALDAVLGRGWLGIPPRLPGSSSSTRRAVTWSRGTRRAPWPSGTPGPAGKCRSSAMALTRYSTFCPKGRTNVRAEFLPVDFQHHVFFV